MLHLQNLSVTTAGKPVLSGVSLTLKRGELYVLMGPNGSGKTSLAYALMGHPLYLIDPSSRITLDQHSFTMAKPEARARAGLFLAFQTPVAVEGVTVQNFLKVAYENLHCRECTENRQPCAHLSVSEFRALLTREAASLSIPTAFLGRPLSSGFSGGERKRLEMLQLLVLKPKYAVLDETDSGLDVDSVKLVAHSITRAMTEYDTGILLITHTHQLLKYLEPNQVSIMIAGQIVETGSLALVDRLETSGYAAFPSV